MKPDDDNGNQQRIFASPIRLLMIPSSWSV